MSGPQGAEDKLENQLSAKEEGLQDFLIYDRRTREDFSEWLLPSDASFEDYRRQKKFPVSELHFGKPVCIPGARARSVWKSVLTAWRALPRCNTIK